ncbi:hypothetical protein CYMTET_22636 [Cymbomonas tetramitiformis]|uniref:Uncharacterized protein n=1 Tax=Cymbomonas tetramitiformis TaxID=36881 RepID=A0AAE0FZS0_9CHLO|nr:hypothetical protein CYMTET_22636 [Cymbomonas tetramitiformis]
MPGAVTQVVRRSDPNKLRRRTISGIVNGSLQAPVSSHKNRKQRPGLVLDDDRDSALFDLLPTDEDSYDNSADSEERVSRTRMLRDWLPDDFIATHCAAQRDDEDYPVVSSCTTSDSLGYEGVLTLETEGSVDGDVDLEDWSLCSELDEYRTGNIATQPHSSDDSSGFQRVELPALGRTSQYSHSYADAVSSTSMEFEILDDDESDTLSMSDTFSVWSSFSVSRNDSTAQPKLAPVQEEDAYSCFDEYEDRKSFGARGFSNKFRESLQRKASRARRLECNAAHLTRHEPSKPSTQVAGTVGHCTKRQSLSRSSNKTHSHSTFSTARARAARHRP